MTRDINNSNSRSSLIRVLTTINSWSKGTTFASRGITDDESLCFQYNPEMKCQSKKCKTSVAPIPEKAHKSGSPVKTMLMLPWSKGHCSQSVCKMWNSKLALLKYWQKDGRLLVVKDWILWPYAWILLHDSAHVHDMVTLEEVSANKSITKFLPSTSFARFDPVQLLPIWKLKTGLKVHKFSDSVCSQWHVATISF
jgi:hypothetical protein